MVRRYTRGLTLVELLTVITIIAVLGAMLFPVYVNAKKSAKRTQCQSNLRQISQAFETYTSDNGGCYPNLNSKCLWMGRYWRWPMKRYLAYRASYNPNDPGAEKQTTHVWNTILRCPADPVPGTVYDGTSYGYSAAFYLSPDQANKITSYAQTYDNSPLEFATIKTSAVRFPTKKAMVADWLSHTDDQASWWKAEGSRNYLFADGHVLYLNSSRINKAADGLPDINVTVDGVEGKDID
jgi:prepilin-type N-terminal cleavage/methylation domain-containing protein/prepilin-type processing-associated H-X9-DG protein